MLQKLTNSKLSLVNKGGRSSRMHSFTHQFLHTFRLQRNFRGRFFFKKKHPYSFKNIQTKNLVRGTVENFFVDSNVANLQGPQMIELGTNLGLAASQVYIFVIQIVPLCSQSLLKYTPSFTLHNLINTWLFSNYFCLKVSVNIHLKKEEQCQRLLIPKYFPNVTFFF